PRLLTVDEVIDDASPFRGASQARAEGSAGHRRNLERRAVALPRRRSGTEHSGNGRDATAIPVRARDLAATPGQAAPGEPKHHRPVGIEPACPPRRVPTTGSRGGRHDRTALLMK